MSECGRVLDPDLQAVFSAIEDGRRRSQYEAGRVGLVEILHKPDTAAGLDSDSVQNPVLKRPSQDTRCLIELSQDGRFGPDGRSGHAEHQGEIAGQKAPYSQVQAGLSVS